MQRNVKLLHGFSKLDGIINIRSNFGRSQVLMFYRKKEHNKNVLWLYTSKKKKNIEPHQNFTGSYKQSIAYRGTERTSRYTEYQKVKR